jgi:cytosolic phospholipase A2
VYTKLIRGDLQQLIVAEKWAKLNHVPFPPVEEQVAKYKEEELKEWYVFENTEDLQCPTILHFVIYNKTFREFKEPGKLIGIIL